MLVSERAFGCALSRNSRALSEHVWSSGERLPTAHEKTFQQSFRRLDREPYATSANGRFDPLGARGLAFRAT
jgi:hypothetical protein